MITVDYTSQGKHPKRFQNQSLHRVVSRKPWLGTLVLTMAQWFVPFVAILQVDFFVEYLDILDTFNSII